MVVDALGFGVFWEKRDFGIIRIYQTEMFAQKHESRCEKLKVVSGFHTRKKGWLDTIHLWGGFSFYASQSDLSSTYLNIFYL